MILILIAFFLNSANSMETFDSCLKKILKCKSLALTKTSKPPANIKPFLQFVTSDQEEAKYKCVIENITLSQHKKECKKATTHFEFHKSCNSDILKFCDWTQPGNNRIRKCLQVNQRRIDRSCLEKLNLNRGRLC